MPRLDLALKVTEILQHVDPPHASHARPLAYYLEVLGANQRMFSYFDRHLGARNTYEAPLQRHMAHLRRMALGQMIEGFERFLKHLAAFCVDQLLPYVADDRFNALGSVTGDQLAQHFATGSAGRALCESGIWLSNQKIREGFGRLLRDPFGEGPWDMPLPSKARRNPRQEYIEPIATTHALAVLWQVRHTLTHNQGELTRSDASKLRQHLVAFNKVRGGQPLQPTAVETDRVLTPTASDLRYVDQFLRKAARSINDSVGRRLAKLVGQFHADFGESPDSSSEVAERIATTCDMPGIRVNDQR